MLTLTEITGVWTRASTQVLRDRGRGAFAIFLCLMLLLQMSVLFVTSINTVSHLLTDSAAVQLNILPAAGESAIQQLYAALKVHPAVRSVEFLSGQQIYEREKALHPDDVALLEQYNFGNPFRGTFSVTLMSLAAYSQFATDMRNDRWKNVLDPAFLTAANNQTEEIRTFLVIADGLFVFGIFLVAVVILAVLCAMAEWIARSNQLLVRHLMGASSGQVMMPCVMQMTVLCAAALVIATLIVAVCVAGLPALLPGLTLSAPFSAFQNAFLSLLRTTLPLFLLIELLCIPVLAYGVTAMIARMRLPRSFTLFA